MKINGIKGQLSRSSFMELARFFFFFRFCNALLHLQGDLFNCPLCRLHQHKQIIKLKKKIFLNKLLYFLNIT